LCVLASLAVISAITAAPSPENAIRELQAAIATSLAGPEKPPLLAGTTIRCTATFVSLT